MEYQRNMVRVGKVSSVNTTRKTARVAFPDLGNMVSRDLFVLQHIGTSITIDDTLLTYDRDGTKTAEEHTHTAQIGAWTPSIGQTVLCLFVPVENGDGYILGGL